MPSLTLIAGTAWISDGSATAAAAAAAQVLQNLGADPERCEAAYWHSIEGKPFEFADAKAWSEAEAAAFAEAFGCNDRAWPKAARLAFARV
jgi:hypothetical protein